MYSWYKKRKQRKLLRDTVSQTRHVLHADDDVLSEDQKKALQGVLDKGMVLQEKEQYSAAAEYRVEASRKIQLHAPKYRSCRMREILDILAVACMVAFGIRGLFAQPFKIPTSSMQPTLFGIHYIEDEVIKTPYPLSLIIYSAVPAKAVIQEDGKLNLDSISRSGDAGFVTKALFGSASFVIGNTRYTLPGTLEKIADYTQLSQEHTYRKGETLSNGWLSLGDHLFVDRFSHHFADFRRGEIVVFNTEGITDSGMPLAGFYYIKRLAGLPGDTLRIDGNQLMVKPAGANEFKPVQELAAAFKKVYSMKGGYQGHLNAVGSGRGRFLGTPSDEFVVPEDSYFMLGDNSLFSSDSRIWGIVPRRNMVGRAGFVFWPFTRRWGLPDHSEPIQVPTTGNVGNTFPQMSLQ